jgi:hypothetical protein
MFIYILDIIESMSAIEEYIKGFDYDKFEENFLIQDAVMMRLSIIGESTAKLTLEFRKSHPDIPWKSMKAVFEKNLGNSIKGLTGYKKANSSNHTFSLIIINKAIASNPNPKNSKYCGQNTIVIGNRLSVESDLITDD